MSLKPGKDEYMYRAMNETLTKNRGRHKEIKQVKVKLATQQAVEAYRGVRC
jgi:hypothetical protein